MKKENKDVVSVYIWTNISSKLVIFFVFKKGSVSIQVVTDPFTREILPDQPVTNQLQNHTWSSQTTLVEIKAFHTISPFTLGIWMFWKGVCFFRRTDAKTTSLR